MLALAQPTRKSKLPKPGQLSPKQLEAQELMGGPQLHTLLVGGARSTKTFLIVRTLCMRAMRAPESRQLITRYRYNHVKASIWYGTLPTVMRICPELRGIRLHPNKSDGFVTFPNGAELWFGGLDEKERVDKILGNEYASIFPNECSQIPYSSIIVLRTRLAQRAQAFNRFGKKDGYLKLRAFYDLNPVGTMHWTNKEFGDLKDPISGRPLTDPQNFKRMFFKPEDNPWLPEETLEMYRNLPGRYRARFYEGKYVPEVDNALWTFDLLEMCRCSPADVPENLVRSVVAVDPSGTKGTDENKRSNDVGIVSAALGDDGRGYLLGDHTCNLPPGGKLVDGPPSAQSGWGAVVVSAFRMNKADCVVAESNYGGEMVRHVIQSVDPNVPVRLVTASRGKVVRAEPVSALYAQDRIRHVGNYPELEEQLANFATDGYKGEGSPDRADAVVWAFTEMMLDLMPEFVMPAPIQVAQGGRLGGNLGH